MTRIASVLCAAAVLAGGCAAPGEDAGPGPEEVGVLDRIAEDYVRLTLAIGVHDPSHVDAYHGPEAWREAAASEAAPLEALLRRARDLVERADTVTAPGDALERRRRDFLATQVRAAEARIEMLSGRTFPFDEESRRVFDAVAPTHDDADFEPFLDALDARLPGDGPLSERWNRFRARFAIPPDRLDVVFRRALDECRARTLAHLDLPPRESFTIDYVTDKPWGAYNWYQGEFRSRIEVNTDLPIYVDRAVDLACHEGYPGHHVYNVLLERDLAAGRGWVEFLVYPLYGPQSLIAEGTANFGIEVAFTGDERVRFERDVLFPLAGLDPADAADYYAALDIVERLSYAANEAARRYLDGAIDRDAAVAWLETHALMSRERAEQRMRFVDGYRAYVINYNLGRDLVRAWVESRGGTADAPELRWELFARLLHEPWTPSELAAGGGREP